MTSDKKKKTSKTRAGKDAKAPNPAFAWLVDYMKAHPDVAYADAAAAAEEAGHKVFPIMWGRAQMMLGRVKAKPRGQGKTAARKAARAKAKADDAGATGDERPAPSRPKRTAAPRETTPSRAAHLPVADDDLPHARDLVERINAGHRAVLMYDGEAWVLAVE